MISRTQILILTTFALLIATGCEKKEAKNTQPSSEASPAVKIKVDKDKAEPSANSPINIPGLLGNIANIKKATEAGDFTQAKAEYKAFDDFWKQQKDSIKTKSPDAYTAIKESKDEVKKTLKEEQPAKDKVLAALQTLEQKSGEIK